MARKLALIIGNSQYEDTGLAKLAAPDVDVRALAEVLQTPGIGAFDEVMPLLNEGLATVRKSIARFFDCKHRDDLLLLYFSGHGVRDEQGHLYLAVRDTERADARRHGHRSLVCDDADGSQRIEAPRARARLLPQRRVRLWRQSGARRSRRDGHGLRRHRARTRRPHRDRFDTVRVGRRSGARRGRELPVYALHDRRAPHRAPPIATRTG